MACEVMWRLVWVRRDFCKIDTVNIVMFGDDIRRCAAVIVGDEVLGVGQYSALIGAHSSPQLRGHGHILISEIFPKPLLGQSICIHCSLNLHALWAWLSAILFALALFPSPGDDHGYCLGQSV